VRRDAEAADAGRVAHGEEDALAEQPVEEPVLRELARIGGVLSVRAL